MPFTWHSVIKFFLLGNSHLYFLRDLIYLSKVILRGWWVEIKKCDLSFPHKHVISFIKMVTGRFTTMSVRRRSFPFRKQAMPLLKAGLH